MTTTYEQKKRCAMCGSESEYTGIGTTNTFGSSDLDTRPPEMKRSTMFAWVERCPQCGYCNHEVSKSSPEAQAIVNSEEYKGQLNDPSCPDLANSFLCVAMLDREKANYNLATWDLIHAAWVCDDAGKLDQAKECRIKAVAMLSVAQEHGDRIGSDDRSNTAMLVDLLRRSGQAEKARQILAAHPEGAEADVISRVLSFQRVLLDRNDVSCHTIAEAIGEK